MVLPSTDSTQTAWPRQRGSSDPSINRTKNEPARQPAQTRAEETAIRPPEEQGVHPLPDETFELNNGNNDDAYPDFTLELSDNQTAEATQTDQSRNTATHPEEARHGRKRPALPFTFGFGIRRPIAVAVMMRHPILGQEAPGTAAQAIQDTLDLAATNRLPYTKGSQLYLAA